MLEAHQNRVIALLENGCEDADVLTEAFASLVQLHEELAIKRAADAKKLLELGQLAGEGAGDAQPLLLSAPPVQALVPHSANDPGPLMSSREMIETGDAALRPATPQTPAMAELPLEFATPKTKNMTPLEISVLTQNNIAMELLLKHGAQPDNISGLSCSALCKVCYMFPWNIAMMRMLLEHGANPDATTNNDTSSASCLIISVVKDNLEAVKLLLEFGADVTYEWKGQNALSMAIDLKKVEVAEALENHEFRRAQDNRWRRFTDRKKVEASREQQRQAVIVQRQLEIDRQRMLHREHVPGDQPRNYDIAGPPAPSSQPTSARRQSSHSDAPAGAPTSVNVLRIDEVPDATPDGHSRAAHQGVSQHAYAPPPPPGALVPLDQQLALAQQAHHHALVAGGGGGNEGVIRDMTSMDWLIPESDVQIIKPISSGAHGEVFEAVLLSTDERVAVKRFPCNDEKSRACFRSECMMLSRFRHENIVMFKGAIISETLCCIVSELCAENLMDRLQRAPIPKWSERLRIARDIAKAMTYLHTRNPVIVHRDLKSSNILHDAHGNVKLCDFGMARTREHTYVATQHISGTPSWCSPEVLRGDDFNEQSDIYSFGVICWELMTLRMPWPDKNMAQLVGLVGFAGARLELPDVGGGNEEKRAAVAAAAASGIPTRVGGGGTIPLPEGCPPSFVTLIRACWEPAPDRPPFKTIKALLDGMLNDID